MVSGKNRRLTFFECKNDMNSMLDIAKVADLVLLLVDASFGFEMETFEFLNILQVHGFPKVMGVLTHLDKFKDNKKQRKTKKRLKHRFWTEIYQGAKLFYLSGLINGKYHKHEIQVMIIISFHFISFHFISFHFISFHFISFHFISFHFISFHFISFHFISYILLEPSEIHISNEIPTSAIPFGTSIRSSRSI